MIKRKTKEELIKLCDTAEKAYFEVVQALPQWQAYRKARDDGLPDVEDLKAPLDQAIDALPEWQDYLKAWQEIEEHIKRKQKRLQEKGGHES